VVQIKSGIDSLISFLSESTDSLIGLIGDMFSALFRLIGSLLVVLFYVFLYLVKLAISVLIVGGVVSLIIWTFEMLLGWNSDFLEIYRTVFVVFVVIDLLIDVVRLVK